LAGRLWRPGQDVNHDPIRMRERESPDACIPALAEDRDFGSSRPLGRLNGPHDSRPQREWPDALRQHAAGQHDLQGVAVLLFLDGPLLRANRFQYNPRVRRVGPHAHLDDRGLS
jgi:hypothetical protein